MVYIDRCACTQLLPFLYLNYIIMPIYRSIHIVFYLITFVKTDESFNSTTPKWTCAETPTIFRGLAHEAVVQKPQAHGS